MILEREKKKKKLSLSLWVVWHKKIFTNIFRKVSQRGKLDEQRKRKRGKLVLST